MVMRFELDQKIERVAAAAVGRNGNHGNRGVKSWPRG